MIKKAMLIAAVLVASGCAAPSCLEKVAVARLTLPAAVDGATALYEAGRIDTAGNAAIIEKVKIADEALDVANDLCLLNRREANGYIGKAEVAIRSIEGN